MRHRTRVTTTIMALGLSLTCSSFSHSVTLDQSVDFSGEIIESCSITITTSGQLGVSADQLKLSSKEVGGVAALANVTTNGVATQVQILNPSSFTVAPLGAETGTVYSTEYTLSGVTVASDVTGTTPSTLLPGLTVLAMDAKAERASPVLPAGNYTLSPTIRCTTP